jgi:hypothetical protein
MPGFARQLLLLLLPLLLPLLPPPPPPKNTQIPITTSITEPLAGSHDSYYYHNYYNYSYLLRPGMHRDIVLTSLTIARPDRTSATPITAPVFEMFKTR